MTSRIILALSLYIANTPPLSAQVDIYQSKAYSPEEICAREAEQANTARYNAAYEKCLATRRNKSPERSGEDFEDEKSFEGKESFEDSEETLPVDQRSPYRERPLKMTSIS